MHQYVPFPYYIGIAIIFNFKFMTPSIEVEYFEQDVVCKHIDRRCMAASLAYAIQSQYSLQ